MTDKLACARCTRATKSLYTCSICRLQSCSKCFLDNLTMCKECLKKSIPQAKVKF